MKVLILGGYGVFGGRLAELLSDVYGLELIICGRNLKSAQAFCERYRGQPTVVPLALDRRDIAEGLDMVGPDLLVDASGPFQTYGSDPYQVVKASIAAGVDYLDFADAADFVFGMSEFDEVAKRKNVFVLSGVSSFPVLTAAVLRQMSTEMDIVKVEGGIAPSPYAGVGLNVMRAVVGYAGAPVKLVRGGKTADGIGLAESLRYTVAVPGRLPLHNIHFSLVDVPDLQVIPPEHPTLTDIWMGAGPVPEVLHRILNLLAKARATLRLPSTLPLSRVFYRVLNLMKFGEHRGGMFVHAHGVRRRDGSRAERSWHLLAEGDDGPFIPSMAIESIIRKLMKGERPAPGARSGVRALELSDYDDLFAGRAIFTGFRDDDRGEHVYRNVLGAAFDSLPDSLRDLHGSPGARRWRGRARVTRGKGLLSRFVGSIFGFPAAASEVPVTVNFSPEQDGELWTRNFGGKVFTSRQTLGRGKDTHLLVERFGAVSVSLALVVDEGRLYFVPRRWSLLGIPLPHRILPSANSFESERSGRFHFDVEISAPVVGLIVAYSGSLEPADVSTSNRDLANS